MIKSSIIDAGIEFVASPDLSALGDFKAYLSGLGFIGGVFRFDEPDLLTMNGSNIVTVADWLGGAATLTQATDARRGQLVYDETLKRNVATFSKANTTNYSQSGGTAINSADPWSVVGVYKPTLPWEFATVVNIGSSCSMGPSADPYLVAGTGGVSVADDPQDPEGWNLHIASHPGANTIRMLSGGRSIVDNSAGSTPSGSGITVGNATGAIAFDGRIDMIMTVRNSDVLADADADILFNILAFCSARGLAT